MYVRKPPNVDGAKGRLMQAMGMFLLPPKDHECDRAYCDPKSEFDMVMDGRLPYPVVDGTVYLCRYGSWHVCTAETCNAYIGMPDGCCPITGMSHGNPMVQRDTGFIKPETRTNNMRGNSVGSSKTMSVPSFTGDTRRTREEEEEFLGKVEDAHNESVKRGGVLLALHAKQSATSAVDAEKRAEILRMEESLKEKRRESMGFKRKKKKKTTSAIKDQDGEGGGKRRRAKRRYMRSADDREKLRRRAEQCIETLLYSPTRKRINDAKAMELASDCKVEIKEYYKEHERGFPNLIEVVTIKANFSLQPPHMLILSTDPDRMDYLVHVILRTWEIVTTSPWGLENPGASFLHHCLGVMYTMRTGWTPNGNSLIPRDPYMAHLPLITDLERFGEDYMRKYQTTGTKNLKSAFHSCLSVGWGPNRLSLNTGRQALLSK